MHFHPTTSTHLLAVTIWTLLHPALCSYYLQQVGSYAFVRALLGDLLGEARDLVGGFGDIFGTLDERPLIPTASSDQSRHLGHQQSHALSGTNDVITLQKTIIV